MADTYDPYWWEHPYKHHDSIRDCFEEQVSMNSFDSDWWEEHRNELEEIKESWQSQPQICPSCHGEGKYLAMGEEDCYKCCGTGRDLNMELWADYCKNCNGRGRVPYCRDFPCKTCGGKGTI